MQTDKRQTAMGVSNDLWSFRKLTGIALFKPTTEIGQAQLAVPLNIFPRIKKIFTDVLEQEEIEKYTKTEEKLALLTIPDVKKALLKLQSKTIDQKQAVIQKKLDIVFKLINTQRDQLTDKKEQEPLVQPKLQQLQNSITTAFTLIADLIFSFGMMLESKQVDLANKFHKFCDSITAEFSLPYLNNYTVFIFNCFLALKKENFLLNKYLGLPCYLRNAHLILGSMIVCILQRIFANLKEGIDPILENEIFMEYYDILEIVIKKTKGPARRNKLMYFHRDCLVYYAGRKQPLVALFHFQIITQPENIKFILSKPGMSMDKYMTLIANAGIQMWEMIQAKNLMPKEDIFDEIGKFIRHLESYENVKMKKGPGILEIEDQKSLKDYKELNEPHNSLQQLIGIYQKFLAEQQLLIPLKKNPIAKQSKKPTQTATVCRRSSSSDKSYPVLELAPPPPPPPALVPPPPTIRVSLVDQDRDKELKKQSYLAKQKKQKPKVQADKDNQPEKLELKKKEEYEIRSKIGHVFYGALCLPEETAESIIMQATAILEKGVIGLKHNQVKYVRESEVREHKLPESVKYKIKGKRDGQLLRIYGTEVPGSNLVEFSILLRKPHKADFPEIPKQIGLQ